MELFIWTYFLNQIGDLRWPLLPIMNVLLNCGIVLNAFNSITNISLVIWWSPSKSYIIFSIQIETTHSQHRQVTYVTFLQIYNDRFVTFKSNPTRRNTCTVLGDQSKCYVILYVSWWNMIKLIYLNFIELFSEWPWHTTTDASIIAPLLPYQSSADLHGLKSRLHLNDPCI